MHFRQLRARAQSLPKQGGPYPLRIILVAITFFASYSAMGAKRARPDGQSRSASARDG
jgi:hypothetical protein